MKSNNLVIKKRKCQKFYKVYQQKLDIFTNNNQEAYYLKDGMNIKSAAACLYFKNSHYLCVLKD